MIMSSNFASKDMASGLRRQLTFEEAARLADVEGPPITYEYAALRLTQSPLFQRMGEKMEEDITAQNVGRMNEVERQHNITNIAMQGGVSRADLEEIMAQMSRMQPPPPPPPPNPPPNMKPPPPGGSVDPPVMGVNPDLPPNPPTRDEADRLKLEAQIRALQEEQEVIKKQSAVAQELTARLSASNAQDPRQEIIRELHQHHVHPISVPTPQTPQDNGPLIQLVGNALTNQNNNIARTAEQLHMSMAQIMEILQGTVRPRNLTFAPQLPPKPSYYNIGDIGRDRSRSRPPGDEEMAQVSDPPPPPAPPPPPNKSTYGPMGKNPQRAFPYEETPQVANKDRPKPLPTGAPVPETPQVAIKDRPKPRPSRAPVPETPQLVSWNRAPTRDRAASVPETPVLPRGSSVDTVRYPSRSRSRALSAETPQLSMMQPPSRSRAVLLPVANEDETPQVGRGRSPTERVLSKIEAQTQRQKHGGGKLFHGKFTERYKASLAAKQAEQRARSRMIPSKPSVADTIEAIESSGNARVEEMSPRGRRAPIRLADFDGGSRGRQVRRRKK